MGERILVVDDETDVRSMLSAMLEAYGYRVRSAISAAEAVRLLPAEIFDLVITDMKMESDTAGYEVVRAAKNQPYQPAVMILSAFPLLVAQWREAGADAVLRKPVSMAELIDLVANLLAGREPRQA